MDLRLVAELLGQNNLLLTLNILGLPLAGLKNVVNVGFLLLGVLNTGGLLVLELLIELSN